MGYASFCDLTWKIEIENRVPIFKSKFTVGVVAVPCRWDKLMEIEKGILLAIFLANIFH